MCRCACVGVGVALVCMCMFMYSFSLLACCQLNSILFAIKWTGMTSVAAIIIQGEPARWRSMEVPKSVFFKII